LFRATTSQALARLTERLMAALHRPPGEADAWRERLEPVLHHAAHRGVWDVGDRLLYELQKACLDMERKVYAIDLVETIVSFGKQPLKRLLTWPRETNVLRRLRAASRLARRQPEAIDPAPLIHALESAIHHVEQRVREANRPVLFQTLDDVGLKPASACEVVARNKLVEELLDSVCARGFLKIGDLRDAIARNRLKLPDLGGPIEFFGGDPLLRANNLLALRMDGVYRRGEIYMRTLQRSSALAFGTPLGRLLVLFVLLPFGGAFVLLEGLQHLIGFALAGFAFVVRHVVGGPSPAPDHGHEGFGLTNPYSIAIVGLLLIGLIQSSRFRRVVGVYARRIFFDLPAAIARSPIARWIFQNATVRFVAKYLFTPIVVGAIVGLALRLLDVNWEPTAAISATSALLTLVVFRTSWGRGIEERLDESLEHVWKVISVNFLVGLLTYISHGFRKTFDLIEKAIYAVDERLRFREGQGPISFASKLVFGVFWFFFTYLFRFVWNLLVEPQINPIKHFPVVTVSHKLILPTVIPPSGPTPSPFARLLMSIFSKLTPEVANGIATSIVTFIPGIFGFLVWELKENWRLYRANGSRTLRAVPVGSHGERVRGLLRPGFHSGVVPKSFAKLREAQVKRDFARESRARLQLEHAAEAIDHLVERELLGYLRESRRWSDSAMPDARVALATNRVRIELDRRDDREPITISIEERGGWLIGGVERRGWLDDLSVAQRTALVDALAGFYKLAGVHLVREQLAAALGLAADRIDCRPRGLVIDPASATPVTINAIEGPTLRADLPLDGREIPPLPIEAVRFDELPIHWEDWVERWEQDQKGANPTTPLLSGYRLI
jgi:hypothetical protein